MRKTIFLHANTQRYNTTMASAKFRSSTLSAMLLSLTIAEATHSATFTHHAADGTVTFSDAPISNGVVQRNSYKSQSVGRQISKPCNGLTTVQIKAKGHELTPLFEKASASSGVSSTLLMAVARAESCFDPVAQSHAGAQGIMQLMPGTARELGVSDSFDIEQNIDGGARYLAAMLARYSYDTDLALAAYNAGPSNVDEHNGIPPFAETHGYIARVKRFLTEYATLDHASL